MPDPRSSQMPLAAEQEVSPDTRAAAVTTAQQARSAADEAMTAADHCGAIARRLGLRIRSTAGFLSHRSTHELNSDTPVVTALATGHTALVAAQAAAEDATGAAADAADAAMAIELELDSLPEV
jgi:hypothetical protein